MCPPLGFIQRREFNLPNDLIFSIILGMDNTQEQKIEDLLTRGVEQIFPSREAFEKLLLSGKKIKLYCGFDPSAASLHVGNAIQINKLAQFQELGHEVVFLVGDFTGMIGDPTDKEAARKKMTREEVLKNSEKYQEQASAYLEFSGENPAKIMYNSGWSDKVSFKDLIDITSNFTVQQMIQRDMFEKRFYGVAKCKKCSKEFSLKSVFSFSPSNKHWNEGTSGTRWMIPWVCPYCGEDHGSLDNLDRTEKTRPIYLHEFLYPVAQGYDSVAMEVDLEVGGNDQMFNMLCGRDLMKAMKGKEKFVMTTKLLADEKGQKMGKTTGNGIFLDQKPEEMFQAVMNWPDSVIGIGFELCTKVPFSEVKEIQKGLKEKTLDPRATKMKLAFELVQLVHGETEAQKAQERYEAVAENKVPEEIKEVKIKEGEKLTALLVETGLAESNSEARRKIEQKAIEIDSQKETDWQRVINKSDDGKILKVGKSTFVKIKIL